jgi:hypothetical protein
MGDMVGVHTDDELEGLTAKQRKQLKQEILKQLHNSPQIRAVIDKQPEILTRDSRINKIVKRKVRPTLDRLKKK